MVQSANPAPYRSKAQKARLLRSVKDVWGEDSVDVILQMTGNAIRLQSDLDKLYEDDQEYLIEMERDAGGETTGKPKIIHRTELAVVVNQQWKQVAEFVVPKPKPIEADPIDDEERRPKLTDEETRARLLSILEEGIRSKQAAVDGEFTE